MQKHFTVMVDWDDEAARWYVGESDVPGLAAEAASIELLREKLALLIPGLIDLNPHRLGGVFGAAKAKTPAGVTRAGVLDGGTGVI